MTCLRNDEMIDHVNGGGKKDLLSQGYRSDGRSWQKDDLVEEVF